MGSRWATPTRKRPLTAQEKRQRAKERQLRACERGTHTLMPTFRPSEQLCTSCNAVFYCSACLQQHGLRPSSSARAYPLPCQEHQQAEAPTGGGKA